MKILKSYKFRLYPTKNQSIFIDKVFNDTRFVWNSLVANFNAYGSPDFRDKLSEKHIKEEYSFLNDSISYALQQKRIDFEATKTQFFNPKRKTKLGRMNFKKKGVARDSFRIPGQALNEPFNLEEGTFKLTKIGKVKVKYDRKPNGVFKSVTISKTKTGKYYISCLVEEESSFKPKTGKAVGIDLGLKELLTLSTGDVIANFRFYRENQSKLKKAQQHLSRKSKASKRRNKAILKVAKLSEKVSNQRSWLLHNISSVLVEQFDIICLEDLNVEGMKKGYLGKSISDASLSELVRMIEYKASWYGKTVVKVGRFYPSSNTCSRCGSVKKDLSLKDRTYECEECGFNIDRDLNASRNIVDQGLRALKDKSVELIDYSRGEEIRLDSVIHYNIASSMKRL